MVLAVSFAANTTKLADVTVSRLDKASICSVKERYSPRAAR